MKVQKELELFSKYKHYYKYANDFDKLNPKVSYQIRYFVCKKLYNNKLLLNNNQIDFLNKKIEEMKVFVASSKQKSIPLDMSRNEFNDLVENIFYNVDEEDRFKNITQKTLGGFKLVMDLIEVSLNFGEIQDKWKAIRKYCKYKVVDLNKSFIEGKEPRRGGPQDHSDNTDNKEKADDDIENELKLLEEENIKEEIANNINEGNVVNNEKGELRKSIGANKDNEGNAVIKDKGELRKSIGANKDNEGNTLIKDKGELRKSIVANKDNEELIKQEAITPLRTSTVYQPVPEKINIKRSNLPENSTINYNAPLNQIIQSNSSHINSSSENSSPLNEIPHQVKNSNLTRSPFPYDINSIRNLQGNSLINCFSNKEEFNQQNNKGVLSSLKLNNQYNLNQTGFPKNMPVNNYNQGQMLRSNINPNNINTTVMNQSQMNQKLYTRNTINNQSNIVMNNLSTPLNLISQTEIPNHPINKNCVQTVISSSPQPSKGKETVKDLFTIESETQFKLPMNKTDKNYNLMMDIIKEHIKYGIYELDFQKVKESINHIEKAIYYLKNIEKN